MKRCYSCFNTFDEAYDICPHCGTVYSAEPAEPIYLLPGTKLCNGRYTIGEAINAGGFGIVYKAWDVKLEIVVAVKEFFSSRLMTRAEGATDVIISKKNIEELTYRKTRFLNEARAMSKFDKHNSIVNVYDYFEENKTAYLVMEYLVGCDLLEFMKQTEGSLDMDFSIMVVEEIGKALTSLHEAGIVHRDVAPDNIFICSPPEMSAKDIQIKLLDLGAAKLTDGSEDVIDIILKPGYSPPEQYDQTSNTKNIGAWMDIYALGATLYHMLTGVKPEESTNRKDIKTDPLTPPAELNPEISENLNNAILQAMAIEKHMRFRSVAEFVQAVRGERKTPPLKLLKRRRRIKRAIGITAACAVVAIAGVSVYGYYDDAKAEVYLRPADISVWYPQNEGSRLNAAMEYIKNDFATSFPDVNVELVSIPAEEYEAAVEEAAEADALPDLFYSSGLEAAHLSEARSVSNVLQSETVADCLFIDSYDTYYSEDKRLPLGFSAPVAYVITKGDVSADFDGTVFTSIDDFATGDIAVDPAEKALVEKNFGSGDYAGMETFLNNNGNTSSVLLSSTMRMREVIETLTRYEKHCVYFSSDSVRCRFEFEWSLGSGEEDENAAADMLLSWMLGANYQDKLMGGLCYDGQLPLNRDCFIKLTSSDENMERIQSVYKNYIFEN